MSLAQIPALSHAGCTDDMDTQPWANPEVAAAAFMQSMEVESAPEPTPEPANEPRLDLLSQDPHGRSA